MLLEDVFTGTEYVDDHNWDTARGIGIYLLHCVVILKSLVKPREHGFDIDVYGNQVLAIQQLVDLLELNIAERVLAGALLIGSLRSAYKMRAELAGIAPGNPL
jgi:hypothetical protein